MIALPVPTLAELLDGVRVVSIPIRIRFRGVMVREAALVRRPNGWGELGPIQEYDDHGSSRWLAAAMESGVGVAWPCSRSHPGQCNGAHGP